jgi:thiamine-monophosphate kinase
VSAERPDEPSTGDEPTETTTGRTTEPRSTEVTRIRMLRTVFGDTAPGFDIAVGDDCAVLAPVASRIVWSIDTAVEGVHFRRDLMTLEDAGYRATMAALSDLAAMGAAPLGLVSGLVLPAELTDRELLAIARGQRDAATLLGTSVVGGNLARGDTISITSSVLGNAERPLYRRGAQVGDDVYIAGALGFAAVGLRLANSPRTTQLSASDESLIGQALQAYRRPYARIDDGLYLARAGATAMIDVSDGLATDATHIADDSRVTIVLEEAHVLASTSTRLCALAQRDALEVILTGGDDYALLATAPRECALPGDRFLRIGRVVPRGEHALLLETSRDLKPIAAAGFDHFG